MLKLSYFRVQFGPSLKRYVSTRPPARVITSLGDRGLLRVSGAEASSFLQGLITNDMRHLDDGGAGSMYAMFLNTKGRVLYDVILYRTRQSGVFLLECDVRALSALQKHLKVYKVRRKIDVDDVGEEIKVWAIFSPTNDDENSAKTKSRNAKSRIFSGDCSSRGRNIAVYRDPRFAGLGLRVLTDGSAGPNDLVADVDAEAVESEDPLSYRSFIYKLGVGEGCDDLPPGKALPLESNCDYLHGVSFHKGCYIGQELTARTYHTGVVRKRLMPVTLDYSDQIPESTLIADDDVTNEADKTVGKLKGRVGRNALGLMRIAETLAARTLKVSGIRGKASKPVWWPIETSKERITLVKTD